MKQTDAIKHFKTHILPTIPANDLPAKREAWGIYIDSLCKDACITLKQYNNWCGPKFTLKNNKTK